MQRFDVGHFHLSSNYWPFGTKHYWHAWADWYPMAQPEVHVYLCIGPNSGIIDGSLHKGKTHVPKSSSNVGGKRAAHASESPTPPTLRTSTRIYLNNAIV
jgi:hypothetical protein